ncbi:calcium-binding protein [Phyllobacterium lublinensis]|uniref:calcium-binding protein n=1 Tax=Phyllobacterium lublinensis TaxID=2875708 RepID=UPI001CC9D671|nr:calcium-binding protein [Phyllobacterium sp. 2063]MBZ9655069.1 hypothetical protein [Phyllobacterium sp. 2063]
MPSALPPYIFDFLQITNGGWQAFAVPRPLPATVNGTTGSDDISFAPIVATTVNGGGRDDRITLEEGGLQLASIVNGGAGSDQLFGNSAVLNTLNGGDGNDYIHGGAGTDVLSGDAGSDTLSYEASPTSVIVNMSTLTLTGGITVSGGHANGDTVSNNFENVVGSNYNDTITGNATANRLFGYGGNDVLNGGGGNDIIRGGDGNDTVLGGAGDETLFGENGDDRLDGQAGYDWLNGGGGRDTFVCSAVGDSSDVNPNRSDHILDLNDCGVRDVVDVSQFDADLTQPGQQHFTVVTDGYVQGGQIGYQPFGTSYGHQIYGNVIGSDEDLRIILQNPTIGGFATPVDFVV